MAYQFKLNSTETMYDLRMKFHYSHSDNDYIRNTIIYDKVSGIAELLDGRTQEPNNEVPLGLMKQFIRDMGIYYDEEFRRSVKEEWFSRATDIKSKLNEEYALK